MPEGKANQEILLLTNARLHETRIYEKKAPASSPIAGEMAQLPKKERLDLHAYPASVGNGLHTNDELSVQTDSFLGSRFGLRSTDSWFSWFEVQTDYQN